MFFDLADKLDVFNRVKYFDGPHEYYIDGVKVSLSATKLISNAKKPFEKDYWAKKKADERGITKAEIIAEWDYKAKVSTEKGTAFHNYVENYLANRVFPYPEAKILSVPEFKGTDPVKDKFDRLTKLFDVFYSDIRGKLVPIKSEFVIGDKELNIAGMIDQIFFNRKEGKLQIWDWKTNKEISTGNRWEHFLAPVSHLEVCELNSYSLQLSIYKYLIEKHTGLEFGDSYLAWFNEENDKYKIIKTHDFRAEAMRLLKVA